MPGPRTKKSYREEIIGALDNDFLRQAMDNFAVAYRATRARVFDGTDLETLLAEIVAAKDGAIGRLEELYEEFKQKAEEGGARVYFASTAAEANEIIADIAARTGSKKIVKSKSMTSEETRLNHFLEDRGHEVTETDLGEWIIQLRGEGPTHMVMPAIHLSRYQVADLFSEVTRKQQDSEIEKLVKVARQNLRQKFFEADMGISGANFAVTETGSLGLVTNEGNARLVTTLPRVHVALVGLDKLTPTLKDALRILKVLPRNATGQLITSYISWITGPTECRAVPGDPKELHIVFLDNGRKALSKDPLFSQVLRCVRCGACANVCPVYRMVGGHQYGHIYIGAIGLILTYFFHGRENARQLVKNCINCGACREVCAAGIDLPRLIKEIHVRIQDEEGHSVPSVLLGKVLQNRRLFHSLLRSVKAVQRPVTGGTPYIRHLPFIFAKDMDFRVLPALADKPFRDLWPSIKPRVSNPKLKAALFSGCLMDFVYPGQMEALVKVAAAGGAEMDFPEDQSCCGLPVLMMGEKKAARRVAEQNLRALDPDRYDVILTGCASCASHLKKAYPDLLAEEPALAEKARRFSEKIRDFSSFIKDQLEMGEDRFEKTNRPTAYHAPCHLCRGLGVVDEPRQLIDLAGQYVPLDEEDVCCGFGGTYSANFPELSAEILKKKLTRVEESEAECLVTDCPGCIMQLRGGMERRGGRTRVMHIAEVLAEALK